MQDRIDTSKWLKLMLVASPFIILLPDSPIEQAADLIRDLTIDAAIERLNRGATLPTVADAVKSVDTIIRKQLRDDADLHSIGHLGSELKFWNKLARIYL